MEGGCEGLRVRLSKSNQRREVDGVRNQNRRVRVLRERELERRDSRE